MRFPCSPQFLFINSLYDLQKQHSQTQKKIEKPNLEMSYLLISSQKNAILFSQEFGIQIEVYTNRHYLKGHCIQHLGCYFHLTVYRP